VRDSDRLDPEQVEALLRELLDAAPAADAAPARWNTGFCASGGKNPC
jgi:hypothetical protein